MKLLKCSSRAVLLVAGPLLFSCCLNAWGAEWQALYVQHPQAVPAPQGHAFAGEPDFMPLGQQTYAPSGQFQGPNPEWDQTVHLRTGENTPPSLEPPGVSAQDPDVEVPIKREAFVTTLARTSSAEARKRTLFLLNMVLLAAVVMAMHLSFSAYYRVRLEAALRVAEQDARARAAQGQGGIHMDEAARRALGMDDLLIAAQERGHHLVADGEYVRLVEKASEVDMWRKSAAQAREPPPYSQHLPPPTAPYSNLFDAPPQGVMPSGVHGFAAPGQGYFGPGNAQWQPQYVANPPARPAPYNPGFFRHP